MSLVYAPSVFLLDTSPNARRRRPGVRVDTVLLHHTASSNDAGTVAWLMDPKSGVSAHYVVGTKGDVWRLVPEELCAWHAGRGRLPWETVPEYDFNHRSLGIEVVNPGDGKTPFTEAQYRALEWLVPDICKRLGGVAAVTLTGTVPASLVGRGRFNPSVYVLGHRDVTRRKTDPADNFDWSRVRESLKRGVAW